MIQGEDKLNLGHTGHTGGWDHGFGAGHGFGWGAPNPYGMGPFSHNEGGHIDVTNNGRIGMITSHKAGFGSGFAGWGNAGTGDMLQTDQEIGDGDFEPHHPLVMPQGRGHFHHNHNHGVGYGFNAGYKSTVASTSSDEDILKNINEAIESEVSGINVEASRLKSDKTAANPSETPNIQPHKIENEIAQTKNVIRVNENSKTEFPLAKVDNAPERNRVTEIDTPPLSSNDEQTAVVAEKKSLFDAEHHIVKSSAQNEPPINI